MQIKGNFTFGNYLLGNGKYAIDATDSWLRLNQQASFASGTYTPGFLRADGGIASGGLGSAGAGTITTTGSINSNTGYRVSSAAASGSYLRGNGSNFVSSTIQAADVPTLNQNTTGYAASAYYMRSPYPYNINITDATTAITLCEPNSLTSVNMHSAHGLFGSWATTLTMSGYERYGAYQISGNYNSAVPELAIRNYVQSTSTWNSWVKLITTANIGSYSDNLGNHTATTTLNMATNQITNSGNLTFSAANPYITASSYFVAPGGAYFNSGTVYTEAQYQCRGGIHNDNNTYLTIAGGTSAISYFTGNVGIGTTAPAYKLHAAGDIYANGGWLRVSGNQGLYFESWGGGWYMQDGTWIRGYNGKSLWMGGGLIGGDGGLTIGYGGASPTGGGAIIAGKVGVGTSAPAASAAVDITSTSQGFLPPRMTTAQRDAIASPAEGLIIFNTTTKCLNFYDGTAWVATCGSSYVPGSLTFNYTGGQQSWIVPAGVTTIAVNVSGAQGNTGGRLGGLGGAASGNLAVTPGQTIYINVGGQSGFNGGASPGNGAGSGGGASDIRVGGTALGNRVVVGGGGGGGGYTCCGWTAEPGGLGGGTSGGAGGSTSGYTGTPGVLGGGGGTQGGGGAGTGGCGCGAAGSGSLGLGGNGSSCASWCSTGGGGGGGGGYFGGGGGSVCGGGDGGGGGSSYIGGISGGSTTSGTRSGNGVVVITW